MAALALVVAVAAVEKHTIGLGLDNIPRWTDDAGYCKGIPKDTDTRRPDGLSPMTIAMGDDIEFTYSTHHDLWAHTSASAYDECSSTFDADGQKIMNPENYPVRDNATRVLLADTTQGGGCPEETDLTCMRAAAPFVLRREVYEQHLVDGKLYISCQVHQHCENGQRLTITVLPALQAAEHQCRSDALSCARALIQTRLELEDMTAEREAAHGAGLGVKEGCEQNSAEGVLLGFFLGALISGVLVAHRKKIFFCLLKGKSGPPPSSAMTTTHTVHRMGGSDDPSWSGTRSGGGVGGVSMTEAPRV